MNREQIKKELQYRTARSSGAGGQHVNKVETKVEVIFDISSSLGLSEPEKTLIISRIENKLTKEGLLQISSQEARSQLQNKEISDKKLFQLLTASLVVEKERKPVRIPKGVVAARKKAKALRSDIKVLRKNISIRDFSNENG